MAILQVFISCVKNHTTTDDVLDVVAGHEMYSFLDCFNRYNQVRMHPDDHEKTTFARKWDVFVVVVMIFGLKTAPPTFERIISEVFGEYISAFMQVFLDDFVVYGTCKDYLHHLRSPPQEAQEKLREEVTTHNSHAGPTSGHHADH